MVTYANRGVPQTTHLYVPSSLWSVYSPLNALKCTKDKIHYLHALIQTNSIFEDVSYLLH